MRRFSIYLVEAWREARETLRGPQIPLIVAGLVGYLLIVLTSAEYLRQLGAADIPRNSPHIVFMMTSGEGFWLIFAWAWVFAQVVTRDRDAELQELVLAAPVSLQGLMLARFAGAFTVACLLGLATPLAFLLVPPLEAISLLPAGPTPWNAMWWSFFVFVVPSALGLGALYTTVALKTRSVAGPFGASAVVVVIWMVAMIIIRGGGFDRDMATWLDPTAFAEVEYQTERWTPAQKASSMLALSAPLLVNRLLWTLPFLSVMAWTLIRLRREALAVVRAPKKRRTRAAPVGPPSLEPLEPLASRRPSWVATALSEARWHLTVSAGGWGFRFAAFLFVLVGVGGAFVHVVAHADGPFIPRPALLSRLLVQFSYVGMVFVIAGFVGVMARRDFRPGFVELVDCAPAPMGARVVGRALAAALLTLALAILPTLSGWVVTAFVAPSSFDFFEPLLYNATTFFPALLEVCAVTLAAHALIRPAGAAHALTMLLVFIAVINHEATLIAYPPAQLAIPVRVTLSELSGLESWVWPLAAGDAFKLGFVLLCVSLAWVAWPRGTATTIRDRFAMAGKRLRGGAGALVATSLVILLGFGWLLHDRLVTEGEFANLEGERLDRATWEKRWWNEAEPYSVQGGQLSALLKPTERKIDVTWTLHGVQSKGQELHLGLPHGLRLERALLDSRELPVESAYDHAVVKLAGCEPACDVELHLSGSLRGWPAEGELPWISSTGIYARAADFVPTLGHAPERKLRGVTVRREHGLPDTPEGQPARALRPAIGVAPAGEWRFVVEVGEGGDTVGLEGVVAGPLDFALAWRPELAERTDSGGIQAWHGPAHRETAQQVLEDVQVMRDCVEARLGGPVQVSQVLQAPRGLGPLALHGTMLWIPEDEGWDVAAEGFGRWQRRAAIGSALAARGLAENVDLRAEAGSRWLSDGVAGWVGLECVHEQDGHDAWVAILERRSDQVVEAFGALSAPIQGLAADGDADWVGVYAPLAVQGWAMSIGSREAFLIVDEVRQRVDGGQGFSDALAASVGLQAAAHLLGPPNASEVGVAAAESGEPRVEGERSSWALGGWTAGSPVDRVVQVVDARDRAHRVIEAPARVQASDRFTVLDAWPSFERSPEDNVWGARDAR